jgi:hypothetical protein
VPVIAHRYFALISRIARLVWLRWFLMHYKQVSYAHGMTILEEQDNSGSGMLYVMETHIWERYDYLKDRRSHNN